MTPPPPRLFVIVARAAPVAVILRRGPSAWAHVLAWDLAHDTLTPGAWFHGRLFAEKCDVSPDGALLVSAAYRGSQLGTAYTDSWTAVSRVPWLHALALWPMGTTYGGGGRFVGPRQLVLRGASEAHPDHAPDGLEIVEGQAPLHASSGEVAGADWSGRDPDNALLYASGGRVFRRRGGSDHELFDLRGLAPDPQPAPAWACRRLPATR